MQDLERDHARKRGGMDIEAIDQAVFSRDGKLIAAWQFGDPTNFGVWDELTGVQRERFQIKDSRCAVFSPNSQQLAVGRSFRDVLTYDLLTKSWTGLASPTS